MSNHLFGHFLDRMPSRDRVLLHTADGPAMTYGGMLDLSGRIANLLLAQGVEPGDRVAVQTEKTIEALMIYLACVRAGAVYLPLNTAYTDHEVSYFLGDAEPKLVVLDPVRVETLASAVYETGASLLTLGEEGKGSLMLGSKEQVTQFEDVAREPDDLAAILYTSGTTGRSKGAMLTHENLASSARVLVDYWHFSQDDVLIHALPIFHTHGLFVATNTVLMAGASMIFLPCFDADEVLRMMERGTVLMGVPTFYTRLLQQPDLTRQATAGMRLFVSGSAPLRAETHAAFAERTGHAILERYGMTETNMNTSNPYDGPRIAGTVGLPLPGVELRVVDAETGAGLPDGQIGMIEVRGPNVFKGYWRMPEKTASEFREDGFFITGDLGRLDERGYLHIVGRGKDLVISGGYNVYPKEIETELDQLAWVSESAVIGVRHPDFGEAVVAVVVPSAGATPDEAATIDALAERLARYKLPKRVCFVDELPRNSMGKVQKNVLRERFASLLDG
ncbi:MAG TPA: malonyl-CoA synthase [Geminicoccus sp.]|jgi:malonyl-CoA/methylmalonyl-CoA synthetase|uniref:malonate--CoA ligase n=1 Tax=Geminicoccus sp. TaxID=2024832 RepID=UPI002E359F1E|nr:malonyl-CoA synthase [Geminicoccus sp.]HEX2527546.1 malonyl-CoA synthase [Geminicoccus sp.]